MVDFTTMYGEIIFSWFVVNMYCFFKWFSVVFSVSFVLISAVCLCWDIQTKPWAFSLRRTGNTRTCTSLLVLCVHMCVWLLAIHFFFFFLSFSVKMSLFFVMTCLLYVMTCLLCVMPCRLFGATSLVHYDMSALCDVLPALWGNFFGALWHVCFVWCLASFVWRLLWCIMTCLLCVMSCRLCVATSLVHYDMSALCDVLPALCGNFFGALWHVCFVWCLAGFVGQLLWCIMTCLLCVMSCRLCLTTSLMCFLWRLVSFMWQLAWFLLWHASSVYVLALCDV